MALPDIPESWSRFINTILLGIIMVLAALGYSKADRVEQQQVVGHQKIDAVHDKQTENSAKIDAAAAAATEVKTTLAASNAAAETRLENIQKTVAALPPAVASAVRKDK